MNDELYRGEYLVEAYWEDLSGRLQVAPYDGRSKLELQVWLYFQGKLQDDARQIDRLTEEIDKLDAETDAYKRALHVEVRYNAELTQKIAEMKVNHAQQIAELKAEMARQAKIELQRSAQTRPGRRKLKIGVALLNACNDS